MTAARLDTPFKPRRAALTAQAMLTGVLAALLALFLVTALALTG